MLTRRLIRTVAMALVTSCRLMSIANAAQASDTNGKWAGKIPFSNGTFLEVTFEFKVKGQELSGRSSAQDSKSRSSMAELMATSSHSRLRGKGRSTRAGFQLTRYK